MKNKDKLWDDYVNARDEVGDGLLFFLCLYIGIIAVAAIAVVVFGIIHLFK